MSTVQPSSKKWLVLGVVGAVALLGCGCGVPIALVAGWLAWPMQPAAQERPHDAPKGAQAALMEVDGAAPAKGDPPPVKGNEVKSDPAAPVKGNEAKREKGDKSAFDSKSPNNTLRWVIDLWEPALDTERTTELAREKHLKATDAAFRKVIDTEIDWTLPVLDVRKTGIVFKDISLKGKAPKFDTAIPIPPGPAPTFILIVGSNVEPKIEKKGLLSIGTVGNPPDGVASKPFAVPADDWVFALKAGDNVRLQGKIAGFKRDSASYGLRAGFIIADHKVSPVMKGK